VDATPDKYKRNKYKQMDKQHEYCDIQSITRWIGILKDVVSQEFALELAKRVKPN